MIEPEAAGELDFAPSRLARAYAGGSSPVAAARAALGRIEAAGDDAVWITRVPAERVLARAASLARQQPGDRGPLWGVPFAVKDNIDVTGLPTSAGCPEFAYVAAESAPVVERLEGAGAMLLGKTNLDQFATGLVGTRSPYGVPRSPFDPSMAPGGSSSGSAVAVAAGLVGFALGTDTAGSGRVPAALNDLVGFKPTRGLVPTRGVVPACRSLDCVSVFARTVEDAVRVLAVLAGPDGRDPTSRAAPPGFDLGAPAPAQFRFGVPRPDQRIFLGDGEAAALYAAAIARAEATGGTAEEIDFGPFAEAAALLYGPWTAERAADLEPWLRERAEALLPVTRAILFAGLDVSGPALFRAQHRLAALAATVARIWERVDALLLPTVPTAHSLAAIEAEPVVRNSELGLYTNFANLLDLCAVAVPAGFLRREGRPPFPFGVSLVGPAWHDGRLASLAARLLGETRAEAAGVSYPDIEIAVFGAHLSGEPLNPSLLALGARLRRSCRTASCYRMIALPDGRPALRRAATGGASLPGEVWAVPAQAVGALLASVGPPLGLGTVTLEDGPCRGFIAEAFEDGEATDITAFGGWRAWRAANT